MFGSKPAPCLKLATNSDTYGRMSEDMDVNCGAIVDGTASVEACGQEIFDLVLAVASGQREQERGPRFRGRRVHAVAAGRGALS